MGPSPLHTLRCLPEATSNDAAEETSARRTSGQPSPPECQTRQVSGLSDIEQRQSRGGEGAYQDAGKYFGMLRIHPPRSVDILQVAVQKGAHDARVVHHQRPHYLARLISQPLRTPEAPCQHAAGDQSKACPHASAGPPLSCCTSLLERPQGMMTAHCSGRCELARSASRLLRPGRAEAQDLVHVAHSGAAVRTAGQVLVIRCCDTHLQVRHRAEHSHTMIARR